MTVQTKNHKLYRHLYATLFISIALSACSRSGFSNLSAFPEIELTEQTSLLMSKKWKESKVELIDYDKSSEPSKNITGQFNKSDLDDVITFSEDGTYEYDEGQTKAVEGSTQKYELGIWHLREDEGTLTLKTADSTTSYELTQLTAKELVLKLTVENEAYHYLITYEPVK